ncbi:MAG TPA: hypothetical protein DEA22_14270 [Blastocatellia bacterium]|nr:hypothetical protein [Blastocatellia bacterium]
MSNVLIKRQSADENNFHSALKGTQIGMFSSRFLFRISESISSAFFARQFGRLTNISGGI